MVRCKGFRLLRAAKRIQKELPTPNSVWSLFPLIKWRAKQSTKCKTSSKKTLRSKKESRSKRHWALNWSVYQSLKISLKLNMSSENRNRALKPATDKRPSGSVARWQKEKNTVFSEQCEWWAKNIFSPLPQRQNVKKFEHENGWWFA